LDKELLVRYGFSLSKKGKFLYCFNVIFWAKDPKFRMIMIRKLILVLVLLYVLPGYAQEAQRQPEQSVNTAQNKFREGQIISGRPAVVSPSKVIVRGHNLSLWGVREIPNLNPHTEAEALLAADNFLAGASAECEVRTVSAKSPRVQCANTNNEDLGLHMIQKGFAIPDRADVLSTVFEDVYIGAVAQAKERKEGIWGASGKSEEASQSLGSSERMLGLLAALFTTLFAMFAALTIFIMRGFKKVIESQNNALALASKEQKIKRRERSIIAGMLLSEIKINKSKIEAYLTIYNETLQSFDNPMQTQKYKTSGDIIQLQPALDRAIFDRNTDKLDSLGQELSRGLVHFYARIKSKPDYENIDAKMPEDQVKALVTDCVKNAEKLDTLAEKLIASFAAGGHKDGNEDDDESAGRPVKTETPDRLAVPN